MLILFSIFLSFVVCTKIYQVKTNSSFVIHPHKSNFDFGDIDIIYGGKGKLRSRSMTLDDNFDEVDSVILLFSLRRKEAIVIENARVLSSNKNVAISVNYFHPQGQIGAQEWTLWSIAMVCKEPGTVKFKAKARIGLKETTISRKFTIEWTKTCKSNDVRKGICVGTERECDLVDDGVVLKNSLTLESGDSYFVQLHERGTQYSLGFVSEPELSSIKVIGEFGAPVMLGDGPITGIFICESCSQESRVPCKDKVWLDLGIHNNIEFDAEILCPKIEPDSEEEEDEEEDQIVFSDQDASFHPQPDAKGMKNEL